MHSVISISINLTKGCLIVLFKSVFSTPANVENITVSSGNMEKSDISQSSEYIIAFTSLLLDMSSIILKSKDWLVISSERILLYSVDLDPVNTKIFKSMPIIFVNVSALNKAKTQHDYYH